MKGVSASAPGKAVLSGEYAVLQNAPAIAAAVNCRAVVRLRATGEDCHRVMTPGYADGEWRFAADGDGIVTWLDEIPEPGLGLVEEAWRACRPQYRKGLSVSVDTGAFVAVESGEKLGFGGSAAAMTALVGALCQLDSRQPEAETLAHAAHRALQSGRGSGVDVAASVHGGVIEFCMENKNCPASRAWPDRLAYRFVWSGVAADTRQQIDKVNTAAIADDDWQRLVIAAEHAATAWGTNNAQRILEAFADYAGTLRQFSTIAGLGIFAAGHDKLADLAASSDVVYKPCGAGGGDIGIVMSEDENAIERFCGHARDLDFQPLAVSLDSVGLNASDGDGH